jgi:hypothetical protein
MEKPFRNPRPAFGIIIRWFLEKQRGSVSFGFNWPRITIGSELL